MSLIHVSQPVGYPTTLQFKPMCVHEILVCVHVLAQLIANGKVRKGKIKEVDWKERKSKKEKKARKEK